MKKLLIKNGRYINPKTNADEKLDVLVVDGKIAELKKEINLVNNAKVIDATNLWVVPGLIDMHCHLRDPGQPEKETIETGTRSAASGGFTSVCPMANTVPPVDNAALVEYVNKTSKKSGLVNVFQVACLSKGLQQEELSPFEELKAAGAVAFSDDGKPIKNLRLFRYALEYSQMLNMPIISHAEETAFSDGVMHEGSVSLKLGMPGIPSCSESAACAREIEIVKEIGGKLHFAHISTKKALDLIKKAKDINLNITCEVTPHHLVLTHCDVQDFNPNKKMDPPLRTEEDRCSLISAVIDGIIDTLSTDHAPHTFEEKSGSFTEAPFGIIGFETALPIYLEVFFHSGKLSPLNLIKLLTLNPASILNIEKGSISLHAAADITVIDPNKDWTYNVNNSYSKSRNSPFHLRKFKGKAIYTIVGGEVVYTSD